MEDLVVAYDINPKWIVQHFGVSLELAEKAVNYLYESSYFHDHMVEDITEALERVEADNG